jgi:hypothetical protein
MNRYFFDVKRHDRSEFDYAGRLLPTAEEARDAAELMAFDMAVKRADELIGSDVVVSTADGRKIFSIPIKESYLSTMPSERGTSPITVNRAREAPTSDDAIKRLRFNLIGETHKIAA